MTGPVLVLSFLGNLVADLDKNLGERADVRTFHRFSRWLLHSNDIDGITRNVDYFPALTILIEEDLNICDWNVTRWDVEARLMNLDQSDGLIDAALGSGNYYDAVGHTDAVYRVLLALEAKPEITPSYSLVLVDEYQDFSLLEVSIIDRLGAVSNVLIAGDDDQALYTFKHASADYLRQLVGSSGYQLFDLPYCSRCTTVLVQATHDIVAAAQRRRLLAGRIDKRFECYVPAKRAESEKYPNIIHARCSVERNGAEYICRYVAEKISQISAEDTAHSREGGHPTVLVVGPVQFVRRVFRYLEREGTPNLDFRTSADQTIEASDGYRRLARDERSRLGWRILVYVLRPLGWEECIRRAILEGEELVDLLSDAFKAQHLGVARILATLLREEEVSVDQQTAVEAALGER